MRTTKLLKKIELSRVSSSRWLGTKCPWENNDAQGRMVATTVLTHLTRLPEKSYHDSIYCYIAPSYNILSINNNFRTVIGGGNKLCSFPLLEWRTEIKFYSLRTSMKLSTCKYLDLHTNKNYCFYFIDINRKKHTKFNYLYQPYKNVKIDLPNLFQS